MTPNRISVREATTFTHDVDNPEDLVQDVDPQDATPKISISKRIAVDDHLRDEVQDGVPGQNPHHAASVPCTTILPTLVETEGE